MRRTLLAATALGSLILMPRPVAADAGFLGTSGIFLAPTAESSDRAVAAIGANYVAAPYRGGARSGSDGTVAQYVAVTILDNTEVSMALMNQNGRLGAQRLDATSSQDGWNVDRAFSIHTRVFQGPFGAPSIALGARDIFGDSVLNRAYYAVATQSVGPVRVSAGYGSEALGGVFLGAEAPLGPRARALAEWVDGNPNVGLRLKMWGGLKADVVMMNGRSLGGGLSWAYRM